MVETNEEQRRPTQEPNWVDIGTLIVLTLTLMAVGFYACEAHRQSDTLTKNFSETVRMANASVKASEIAEKTLHITQAADIAFDSVLCTTPPQPLGLETGIFIVSHNFGKTTARKVIGEWSLRVENRPAQQMQVPASENVVPPGGQILSEGMVVKAVVDEDELRVINKGHLRFYVTIAMKYEDVFGVAHHYEGEITYVPNTPCNFRIGRQNSE
jgi:hypothetical protein